MAVNPLAGWQPGRWDKVFDSYRQGNERRQLKMALQVLSDDAEVQDPRTAIQRMLDKSEFKAPSKGEAEAIITTINPKLGMMIKEAEVNKKIKEAQARRQKLKDDSDREERISVQTTRLMKELRGMWKPLLDKNLTDQQRGDMALGLLPIINQIAPDMPTTGLAEDFAGGFSLEKAQSTGAALGALDAPGGTEFERLMRRIDEYGWGSLNVHEQDRVKKMNASQGMVMTFGEDGTPTGFAQGEDAAGMLTKSQKGKAKESFRNQAGSAEMFVTLADRVMSKVRGNSAQLGVTGFISRMGEEIKSIYDNAGIVIGDDVSMNPDDYDLGALGDISAAHKTNMFQLALMFAAASGLGEGRALTDADIRHAVTAIGGSTNSSSMLEARLEEIIQTLDDKLRIKAKHSDGELSYRSILPQQPEQVSDEDWAILTRDQKRRAVAAAKRMSGS